MRLFINYNKNEQAYLSVLKFFLRKLGYEAFLSSSSLSIGELITKAKNANCDAIFLVNEDTLQQCVPGNKPTLADWRGSRLNFSVPCIVGSNLAHTQTILHGSWLLQKDLEKFKYIHKKPVEFKYTVLDTVDTFQDAFEILKKAEFIAYDIETKTFNNTNTLITCCSWTAVHEDSSLHTFVLPLIDFNQDHWLTSEEYGKALQLLRAVNKLDIPKVMHNGMYDCMYSIVYGAEPNYWVLDTMAMMHAEYSELPKTLDFVASITLYDYCQWKSEAQIAAKTKDIQRYWAYNAKDTHTTARVCLHYLANLPAYARKNYQIQFPLVYPSLYCGFEGIKISQSTRDKLREKELARLESSLTSLQTMLNDPDFNPASPKQVQTYIYDILGAADPKIGTKKDSTGTKVRKTRATDAKNLAAIGLQHPILLRVTNAITEYREARKAISTYMDFVQLNGRLMYSLNPFGTESGRMSCNSSSFWCGTQVQNIPSYAKAMLVADDGFTMAEIDNSQSEARCTAYLAQDLKLIEALEDEEKDFYTSLGTLFFGIPYEKVTKEFRNKILKKIVHGTNYMMGAKTFIESAGAQNLIEASASLNVKLTLSDKPKQGELTLKQFATMLLESYHVPFFRVRQWYQEIKNEIKTTGMLKSPLGYTRYFFGDIEKNHAMLNSAVAHAPQNLSVSILNRGFWKVWQLVKKYNGALRLKAQIHDSILFQYRSDMPEIRDEVLKAMDNPVTVHGRILRIPVECKEGDSWGTMKQVK